MFLWCFSMNFVINKVSKKPDQTMPSKDIKWSIFLPSTPRDFFTGLGCQIIRFSMRVIRLLYQDCTTMTIRRWAKFLQSCIIMRNLFLWIVTYRICINLPFSENVKNNLTEIFLPTKPWTKGHSYWFPLPDGKIPGPFFLMERLWTWIACFIYRLI